MTAFRYRAVSVDGAEISGILDADTTRHARNLLRQRGLFPRDVVAAATDQGGADRRLRLSTSDLTLLTRQWATLIAAGLPIERSLAALIDQSEQEKIRRVLATVRSEINAGHSLSDAAALFPRVFPPIYRALLRAGEKSGELPQVLMKLADYLEARHRTAQKVLQAMLYPSLVSLVALATIIGLMTYVVPHLVEVFQHSKQSLPLLTRMLILISDTLRRWGLVLLVLLACAAGLAWRALRDINLRRRWESALLRIPVLGRLLRTMDSARFAQTLAILVNGGVPLLAALEAGHDVVYLLPLRDSVKSAIQAVREGSSLATSLGRGRQFPPLLLHLIASGEASGKLGELLDRAAGQQRDEVDSRLALLVGLLEPLLIVVMGAIVLLIVLAVLQPIIELNQLTLH